MKVRKQALRRGQRSGFLLLAQAGPYYLRTLAMRSHLSDLGSEACRKEERERAEKRVLRQQFFFVPTKSVFPYSFLALSLVQIGHVLTRSFFKIFEPLKDAVGILLTGLSLCQ